MRLESLRRRRRLAGAIGAVAAAVVTVSLLTVGGASGAGRASVVLATFDTPGTYTWTVPTTGVSRVTFDVFGAAGGNVMAGDFLVAEGGAGGEASGKFTVKPGEKYEIVIGGRGGNATGAAGGAGGFNGGGRGGDAPSGVRGGGGGGGGSDVRVGGIGNPCLSDLSCGFGGRLIVGGGGGGGGRNLDGARADGGAGGGLVGGPDAVLGGTQERGGDPGSPSGLGRGAFGLGGAGLTSGDGGGGGGGGWWGGAGQSGGGSGFISFFARKGSFPGGTRVGNGLVVIRTP